MGLLDDILAGLGTQGSAGQSMPQAGYQPQAQSAGGGMTKVMVALLPVVLAMVSNRSSSSGAQMRPNQPSGSAGGGLDDLLGALFGARGGSAGAGGLGELLNQLQRAGFGEQAQSWVGRGQNQPLPPEAMEQVFGRKGMSEIAKRAGVSEADATRGLSQLLPEVVDHVTPEGQVPNFDALTASVDALTRRMGGA